MVVFRRLTTALIIKFWCEGKAGEIERERERERERHTERQKKIADDWGACFRQKLTKFQVSVCRINSYSNKAFFKCACVLAHGGGFLVINNSCDNKVLG